MSPYGRTFVLAIATATGMWAQNAYNATQIGAYYGFPGYSWATGINNSGQVVGGSTDGLHSCATSTFWSGFLYSGRGTSFIGGGPATAINDSGRIVGYYAAGPGIGGCVGYAYLYSGGVSTALGVLPDYFYSAANGIDNSGQVVGYVLRSFGHGPEYEAVLYTGGVITGLGFLPGGTSSVANGINNGQIVGYSTNSSGRSEAFLDSGGVMTGLGTLPGYSDSVANAINGTGQIVGYATDSSGNSQALLYSNGVMRGLGTLPGGTFSQANAINSQGQIVGYSAGPGAAGLSLQRWPDVRPQQPGC